MLMQRFPWLLEPNFLNILIRAVLALICGGIIGYDRNVRGQAAGVRTHILVCLGAMIAMSTGQFTSIMYGGVDATRIGASVVSGIGFLGAGTIIVTRDNRIHGLTTAAGLWTAGCIGLAIGVGFYEAAIIGTLAVFFTERMLRRVSKRIRMTHTSTHWQTTSGDAEKTDGSTEKSE